MFEKIESLSKKTSITRAEMKQGVVALVKGLNVYFDKKSSVQSDAEYINKVWNNFQLCEMTMTLIGNLTPEEFVETFPAEKIYDGKKYQTKDWFSTNKAVQELSKDAPITESKEVFELLWDYHNWDLNIFTVNVMTAMSDINRLEKGKGLFEQFLEDQGVKTYTQNVDGIDIIGVDSEEQNEN
ncbi:hypothetical protein VNN36_06200 [Lactococcus garvieae]|uniref:hypothetical protein n=1 Tax=Lactococcus garvieae TaxID=1363 RepID=UPI0030D184FF